MDYGGDRDKTRGGRMDYGGDRDRPRGSRMDYGGDRDPAPARGGRMDYGDRDAAPPRGGRMDYGGHHDPLGRGHMDYDDLRDVPGHGRRDYGDDRDGSRRRPRDYGRVPYRDERDRGYRNASGSYDAPPEYMLPDHPSDLGRPSLRAGKKESDYFGGPSDQSVNRDREYFGRPGRRSIDKERELFGDDGVTLRISATDLGRTSALYPDCRSPPPPPWAVLSPPPLYPSVLPTETGFLTGASALKAGDGLGAGSTRLLLDDGEFKYLEHLRDLYVESREIERDCLGSRDVLVEKDGGTGRLFSDEGVPGFKKPTGGW
ncbi:histone-lysine N-methyltransferase, H3 lysine-4 specific-like [Phragmites australis]|uniref:histone-lysine N-methyltransferase, H3 lysine-4 specific-like n=1 Tax=Phragmites australis TaxID=29695 RepID=UPI002D76DCFE|nr:histone-lysine N-methyltransferase, H3 lysine-4 specific-like [Phragmites australis]